VSELKDFIDGMPELPADSQVPNAAEPWRNGFRWGWKYALDELKRQAAAHADAANERLDKISGWHSRESGPGGVAGDYCTECGHVWPCDTRRMADGTFAVVPEVER